MTNQTCFLYQDLSIRICPGCIIYVLPHQIASQGTKREPFLVWHIKPEERMPSRALTSTCYQALLHLSLIQKLHLKEIIAINGCVSAKQHNASDNTKLYHHLSYYYTVYYYAVAVAALIRGPLGKHGCGGFCYCLKSHFALIISLNFICLLRQHRFLPLIVSSGKRVFMCEGRKQIWVFDPLLSDHRRDIVTNRSNSVC